MQRIASHYIWCGRSYRMHYLELTDEGTFIGVYPLTEEISSTEFYDGMLLVLPQIEFKFHLDEIPVSSSRNLNFTQVNEWLDQMTSKAQIKQMETGMPVCLFLLNNQTLSPTELRTDNRSGNRYI